MKIFLPYPITCPNKYSPDGTGSIGGGWHDLDNGYAKALLNTGQAWDESTWKKHNKHIETATAKTTVEKRENRSAKKVEKEKETAPAPSNSKYEKNVKVG